MPFDPDLPLFTSADVRTLFPGVAQETLSTWLQRGALRLVDGVTGRGRARMWTVHEAFNAYALALVMRTTPVALVDASALAAVIAGEASRILSDRLSGAEARMRPEILALHRYVIIRPGHDGFSWALSHEPRGPEDNPDALPACTVIDVPTVAATVLAGLSRVMDARTASKAPPIPRPAPIGSKRGRTLSTKRLSASRARK